MIRRFQAHRHLLGENCSHCLAERQNDAIAAVVEAARACFGRVIDTETGEQWLESAVCLWNTAALVDAIRRLDGYPPYGNGKQAPA